MIVLKFGGSNLKSKENLKRILEIIHSYKEPFIIVVSAVYGVTDDIINALEDIKTLDINDFLSKLNNIYQSFFDEECIGLRERVYEIEDILYEVKLKGKVQPFVYDRIVSHGERCSSFLIAKYLNDNGIKCKEAFPEDFKLVTDGKFRNASVDLIASEQNLKEFFKENEHYVVPGFYGIYDDKVVLLGRGGSDYTATSIAFCVNAERVDIFKDVAGFMTCDPKLIKDAKPVKNLNYDEAAELSYFGAKILHHAAINPLRCKNIPLRIYNVNSFLAIDNPDTIISSKDVYDERIVKSISFTDDIFIIKFKGTNVGRVPGLLGQITSNLGNKKINIRSVITSQTDINILISKEDIERCGKIIEKIKVSEIEEIEYRRGISLIAVVGRGLLKKEEISAKILTSLSQEKINVEMIAVGASDLTIYLVVDSRNRDKALLSIHKELFY